jgi:hypothetical protein
VGGVEVVVEVVVVVEELDGPEVTPDEGTSEEGVAKTGVGGVTGFSTFGEDAFFGTPQDEVLAIRHDVTEMVDTLENSS